MVVELAAVRLLAPWFGTSQVVWTNVIAVILLALSLGYLLAGKLAVRPRPLRTLSWVLFGAAALVAWSPFLGATSAHAFLPPGLGLHEAVELVGWGSLAVALLVFLPPALLLGMVSPLVVEELARTRGTSAGTAGGQVLCVSTLGSLVGVFGTSHWMLPTLGIQRTFLLAGALLLAAGVAARAGSRAGGGRGGLLALIVLASSAPLVSSAPPELPEGRRELARLESTYQRIRVVEDGTFDPPMRFLQVNESFDSFQSAWQPRAGRLPEGFYYNDFLLPLTWSEPGDARWSVLVLGLGAGTAVRVIEGETSRPLRFVGVELDPSVVELAEEWMDLEPGTGGLEVWSSLDARVALRSAQESFDQVVLDCYANQVEIPPHLATRQFFAEIRERLTPGGWLTANLGGFGFDDPVVVAVAETCAAAFETPVQVVRVPRSRNFMLLARRDRPLPELPWRRADLGAHSLPGFVRVVAPPASAPLTDDRCPIERTQARSLREARQRRLEGVGT
jgi:spermidine synthase